LAKRKEQKTGWGVESRLDGTTNSASNFERAMERGSKRNGDNLVLKVIEGSQGHSDCGGRGGRGGEGNVQYSSR